MIRILIALAFVLLASPVFAQDHIPLGDVRASDFYGTWCNHAGGYCELYETNGNYTWMSLAGRVRQGTWHLEAPDMDHGRMPTLIVSMGTFEYVCPITLMLKNAFVYLGRNDEEETMVRYRDAQGAPRRSM